MIKPDAHLTISRVPLCCIQIKEYQGRYIEQVSKYVSLLKAYPGEYVGLLYLKASDSHAGMFTLLDGHHRYCAYVIAGRPDALCVIEEREQERE